MPRGNIVPCCNIAVKKPETIIPAETEILGEVQRRGSESSVDMIEGSLKFVERYGLFVCHSFCGC